MESYRTAFCIWLVSLTVLFWRFILAVACFCVPFLLCCFDQSLSRVWLFAAPRTAAHQASLSFMVSWSLFKLMSIELVMPSNHLILCLPLLLLPSVFSSIRGFSHELPLHIRWPKCWIFSSNSISVLPMNIQDWFPLGLTGLISLLFKGLSRVFSSTTVESIKCSALSFLYGPTLAPICDYWKNHSFDHMDLCRWSDRSAF